MSDKRWFLQSTARLVNEVVADSDLSSVSKVGMLGYYMGQLDGASIVVDGDPKFFMDCCGLRDEIKQLRDKIE